VIERRGAVSGEGESLACQLDQAINAAVTAVMNNHGGALPPLLWFAQAQGLSGMADVGTYTEKEVEPVLFRWAGRFGLRRVADRPHLPCMVEYAGAIEGQQVRIWGIVDRAGWEAAMSAPTSRQGKGD
jgi:hypothetical protein